jgi:Flp pilus assembly protein TadD
MYYINLSHAYRLLKLPAEAVRVARSGLAGNGDLFELYDALGVALGDLGKPQEAVAALQEAVRRNPNDSNANYNLALALLAVGRPDEAVAALKHTLVLQPTYPNALLFLGRMEMDEKDWDAAAQYLKPLYESHPEMPESRQMMALWHLRMGEAAEARSDRPDAERQYRAGLAINPNLADLQVSLGVLLLVQGRIPEAVKPLEDYHRLEPKNAQGCLFLGQVCAATGRIDDARRLLTEGAALADQAGNPGTAKNCREILRDL